jgi:hypothetical protein
MCTTGFQISPEMMKLLVADPRINIPVPPTFLVHLCEFGEAESIRIALSALPSHSYFSDTIKFQMLEKCVVRGHSGATRALLGDPLWESFEKRPSLLISAVISQDPETVREVRRWLQDIRAEKFSPLVMQNAVKFGNPEIFKFLLDEGFPPISKILEKAAEYRNRDILEICVSRGIIEGEDEALIAGCLQGEVEVVRFLLSGTQANPSANQSACLYDACTRNFSSVVDLLLADGRVDISDAEYRAVSEYVSSSPFSSPHSLLSCLGPLMHYTAKWLSKQPSKKLNGCFLPLKCATKTHSLYFPTLLA